MSHHAKIIKASGIPIKVKISNKASGGIIKDTISPGRISLPGVFSILDKIFEVIFLPIKINTRPTTKAAKIENKFAHKYICHQLIVFTGIFFVQFFQIFLIDQKYSLHSWKYR